MTRRRNPGKVGGAYSSNKSILTQKAGFEVQLYHVLLSCPVGQIFKCHKMQHMTSCSVVRDGVKMEEDEKGERDASIDPTV